MQFKDFGILYIKQKLGLNSQNDIEFQKKIDVLICDNQCVEFDYNKGYDSITKFTPN